MYHKQPIWGVVMAKHKGQETLKELTREYTEKKQRYIQFAEKRNARRALRQEDTLQVIGNIVGYVERCKEEDKPLTVAGLQIAIKPPMGINADTLARYESGDFDYMLEELLDRYNINTESNVTEINSIPTIIDNDGEPVSAYLTYSEILKWARLIMQEEVETRMYSSKGGNRVTDIFALKAKFGWRDDGNKVIQDNRKIVIATDEQMVRGLIDTGIYSKDEAE